MMTVIIDGTKVQVEKGTTILKAAKEIGIEIPVFCWHEKMEPFGGCRLCLVEVENMPKLQIACATEVSDGMVVKTDTPRVTKARKGVLEFLLINHPLDCPTCDKGGECQLQDAVFKYGSDRSRFNEKKRRYVADKSSTFDDLSLGPRIIRNMNRCIHCLKCIRFTQEIAGEDDLGVFKRGYKTEINILPDIPVDNDLSGNVVELCPVGALTSRSFRYKIRSWLLKKTETICPNCGDGCNISIWVKNSHLYRVSSNRNDKIDEGFICDKGRFGCEFVNSKDRLTSPLVKKGNQLVPASWEEAFNLIAGKFGQIRKEWGSDALAGVGSSVCTNEDNYVFQKFFRIVVGTNNLDFRVGLSSLLPGPDLSGYDTIYSMTNSIADLEKAKTILVFGCDLADEHPIISLRVRKAVRKYNADLILFNPTSTKMGRFASREIIYKKGTELVLINGLLNLIVNDSKFDSRKLGLGQGKLEEISEEIKNYTVENVSSICEISKEWVDRLKGSILLTGSLVILAGGKVLNHPENRDIIRSLNNLLVLSGHLKDKESGFNLVWPDSNSQGASDMGVLPDRLPGLVSVSDEQERRSLGELWNTKISDRVGHNFRQMLEAASTGGLKGIYFMQTNPFYQYPDQNVLRDALEKLDFVVVQDILPNELTKMAHVVLPGYSFAEKEGTCTNVERRIQRLKKGFGPIRGLKADWQTINELALNMGHDLGYHSTEEINKEIRKAVRLYRDMRYESLNGDGFQWVCSVMENRKEFELKIAHHKVSSWE